MDLAEDLVGVLVFLCQKPRFACALAGLRVSVLVFWFAGIKKPALCGGGSLGVALLVGITSNN
jgi:hypothetical protein